MFEKLMDTTAGCLGIASHLISTINFQTYMQMVSLDYCNEMQMQIYNDTIADAMEKLF